MAVSSSSSSSLPRCRRRRWRRAAPATALMLMPLMLLIVAVVRRRSVVVMGFPSTGWWCHGRQRRRRRRRRQRGRSAIPMMRTTRPPDREEEEQPRHRNRGHHPDDPLPGNPSRGRSRDRARIHDESAFRNNTGDNNDAFERKAAAAAAAAFGGAFVDRRTVLVLSGVTAVATAARTAAGASATEGFPDCTGGDGATVHHAASPEKETETPSSHGITEKDGDVLLESASVYRVGGKGGGGLSPSGTPRPSSLFRRGPSADRVTRDVLLRDLRTKRAVFLGEHHPDGRDHLLQAALIRSLHGALLAEGTPQRGDGREAAETTTTTTTRLAVGLEAVQRRFQPVLDRYSAGSIDEEELRRATEWDSRWYWSFDAYRPIFRACRELGIALLALDVATEDRVLVEAGGLGALDPRALRGYVPDPEGFEAFGSTAAYAAFVACTLKPPYELGRRTTPVLGRQAGGRPPISFTDFVARQMLRDESMAAVVAGWLSEHPTGAVVGCVGINHATFGCGVPGRVERMLAAAAAAATARDDGDDRRSSRVASVLINPEPLNTGTELRVCRVAGGTPEDDEEDDDEDDRSARIFVPNRRNEICIENSLELQNYALRLEYGSPPPSSGNRHNRGAGADLEASSTGDGDRPFLDLSDYLVFSPKEEA